MSASGELTGGRVVTLVKETSVVLALTLFLPFVVHVIPSWDDSPLGARLLPIFYAPLGALLLGRYGVALTASFLAPWLNHILTGHPAVPMAALLCLQLVVFLYIGKVLLHRSTPGWMIGPAGYLGALVVTALLGSALVLAGQPFPLQLPAVPMVVWRGLPGILILALIGYGFSRHRPHAA